jgi:hypothetical protein
MGYLERVGLRLDVEIEVRREGQQPVAVAADVAGRAAIGSWNRCRTSSSHL